MNTEQRTKLLTQWNEVEPEIAYFSSDKKVFNLASHDLTRSMAIEISNTSIEAWDRLLPLIIDQTCLMHGLSIGFSVTDDHKYVASIVQPEKEDLAISYPNFSKGLALIDAYMQHLYQIGVVKCR